MLLSTTRAMLSTVAGESLPAGAGETTVKEEGALVFSEPGATTKVTVMVTIRECCDKEIRVFPSVIEK